MSKRTLSRVEACALFFAPFAPLRCPYMPFVRFGQETELCQLHGQKAIKDSIPIGSKQGIIKSGMTAIHASIDPVNL